MQDLQNITILFKLTLLNEQLDISQETVADFDKFRMFENLFGPMNRNYLDKIKTLLVYD